jgi:hypothetical protein
MRENEDSNFNQSIYNKIKIEDYKQRRAKGSSCVRAHQLLRILISGPTGNFFSDIVFCSGYI